MAIGVNIADRGPEYATGVVEMYLYESSAAKVYHYTSSNASIAAYALWNKRFIEERTIEGEVIMYHNDLGYFFNLLSRIIRLQWRRLFT